MGRKGNESNISDQVSGGFFLQGRSQRIVSFGGNKEITVFWPLGQLRIYT